MFSCRGWRLALAGCIISLCFACSDPPGGAGGSGGMGGMGGLGGAGGDCTIDAINACLALQNCCEAILINPVFFQSCNSVVLQCNEEQCNALLAGYVQCQGLDL